MTFYISCYPIYNRNNIITPKESLKKNFIDIKFTSIQMGVDRKIEARMLYEINLNESYTAEEAVECKAEIIAGLMAFSAVEYNLDQAKTLAEKVTKKTFDIKTDKIEMIEEE